MAGDNLQILHPPAEHSACLFSHIFVRCTVKTVTAHLVSFVILIRQSIQVCIVRHCRMERCIECGYLRNTRQQFGHRPDTKQIGRVMKRGYFAACLNLLFRIGIHEDTVGKKFASVGYPVAYRLYLLHGRNHPVVSIKQFLENTGYCDFMIGYGHFYHIFVGSRLAMGKDGHVHAYTFHKPFGLQLIIILAPHIEQLIFQGGATAIQYKYLHFH